MIIRPADLTKDALAIAEGARDFANQTVIKSIFPQGDDLIVALSKIVTLPNVEILIAEHEGRVVGGIGFVYAPYMWNQDILTAEELFWWTSDGAPMRAGKGLIDTAMERINELNAIPMFRSLSTSPKGVDKVYRRYGMEPVETLYMRIPNGS